MENTMKVLHLLGEADYRIKEGIRTKAEQREYLSTCKKGLTVGEKVIYTSRELLCSENFIKASTCLMQTMMKVDNNDYEDNENLYSLWSKLPEDRKKLLTDYTYEKHMQYDEVRQKSRDPKVSIRRVDSQYTLENIDIKLKHSISLFNSTNENNQFFRIPDADFLSTFSIGLTKYFINEYLFAGKLNQIQKEVDGSEIYESLKGTLYKEEDRFNDMIKKYNKYYNDDNLGL